MKVEKAYTIGVFECSKDIVFINRTRSIVPATGISNAYRKGWPTSEKFLDISPVCAMKIEAEAEW